MAAPTHKRPKTQAEDRLLFASLVVVLASFLIIVTTYVVHHWQRNDTAGTILTSQQQARTPAYSASIKNISENAKFDPAFTLDSSETMLILDFSITNTTKVNQDFIPSTQLYIRTPGGDYRTLHPSMYVKNQIYSGTLKPGQTVSGQVSFGVPKAAASLLLYVDTGWLDQTPSVFNVLR